MQRKLAFLYGVLCYVAFLATFVYSIGFIGNVLTPTSLDGAPKAPLLRALLIDVGLLGLFAIQHSVMARQWFKRWWTRAIPEPVERSTYVLFSSVALLLLFWLWEPIGGVIWEVQGHIGRVTFQHFYALGWAIVFVATLLINHFDLFGVRQVWLYLREEPYTPLQFRTPFLYRYMRHPLYLGWLLVFWSAPTMTAAHLLFAIATTAYIFIAIQFEERDLMKIHGSKYALYRKNVPMILPVAGDAASKMSPLEVFKAEMSTDHAWSD